MASRTVEVVVAGPDSARRIMTERGEYTGDFHRRTLRMAIAMRGGVSLAVWIGGTVAEVDLIRRLRLFTTDTGDVRVVLLWHEEDAPPRTVLDRVSIYGRLLAERRFHRVEPDVLAGASAGGLNSVLFAVAQRQGRDFAQFQGVWETTGSLSALLRPPGFSHVPSLLSGDYFYTEVFEALVGDPAAAPDGIHNEYLVAEHVSVDLSATILDAQEDGQPEIRSGRGGFHFEGATAPALLVPAGSGWATPPVGTDPGNAIPVVPTTDGEKLQYHRDLRRLALAARTTSSFPGAFEAVELRSIEIADGLVHVEDVVPPPGGAGDPRYVDQSMSFLAHRRLETADRYQVVDGGVLDNIPITRAFRAIRPRAADHPTERHLIYLDPDPEQMPILPPLTGRRFRTLMSVLLPVGGFTRSSETEAQDVDRIRAYVADMFTTQCRLEALAQTTPSWTAAAKDARAGAYIRGRVSRDVAALQEAVLDPADWQSTSHIAARRSARRPTDNGLAARWEQRLDAFRDALTGRFDDAGRVPALRNRVLRDPQSRLDAAVCLLGGIRTIPEKFQECGPDHFTTAVAALLQTARAHCYAELQQAQMEIDTRIWRIVAMVQPGSTAPHLG